MLKKIKRVIEKKTLAGTLQKFMCDCAVCLLLTRAQDTPVFGGQLWDEGMTLPFQ